MRYFSEIAYLGSRYHGWQKQQNAVSVQETIENALTTILGNTIEVVGCGRTDTGVHASQYFMHFDFDANFPKSFLPRLNKFLPPDVVVRAIYPVAADKHARFDAVSRSYEYQIVFEKTVFGKDTKWFFPFFEKLDFEKLELAAKVLYEFEEFYPFCKTHSDAQTMRCQITNSEWQFIEKGMTYHISANRFLRGMVRLIVGMCLNVALEKITLEDVRRALALQTPLKKNWSVPAHGLFLTKVEY